MEIMDTEEREDMQAKGISNKFHKIVVEISQISRKMPIQV
jgi:hypothetical protein